MNDSDLDVKIQMDVEKPKETKIKSQEKNESSQENKLEEKIDITNFLQHAQNPFIVIFTLIFKCLSIIMYYFILDFLFLINFLEKLYHLF